MLRDTAVAKEKCLKFYYRWTGQYAQNTCDILPAPQYSPSSQRIYTSIGKDCSRTWPGSSTKWRMEHEEIAVREKEGRGSRDAFRVGQKGVNDSVCGWRGRGCDGSGDKCGD